MTRDDEVLGGPAQTRTPAADREGESAPVRVAASFVGCKVSQADGEEALASLAAAGLEPVTSREAASVVVVHTCCVTAEAERKSRRLVRRAASAGKRVIVAGCAAVLRPEQFEGEGVLVAAPADWTGIGRELMGSVAAVDAGPGDDGRGEVVCLGVGAVCGAAVDSGEGASEGSAEGSVTQYAGGSEDSASEGSAEGFDSGSAQGSEGGSDDGSENDSAQGAEEGSDSGSPEGSESGSVQGSENGPDPQTTIPPTAGSAAGEAPRATPGARTRLVLKVQDGCAGACTYCVVRLVRGEPRSTSLEAVLAAARTGLERGCGEVVLSGIDLGAWRDDEATPTGAAGPSGARLPELVAAVAELDGLRRVRLSSVEPRHVTPALVERLAHSRVARHLHVPLQSADDGVLRAMKRPYTFERYLRSVGALRDVLGGAMLSTDVIVGFPTEDEAAFAHTLEALESGLFGRVHVFAYSARPGTAAAELPPLPAAVVKERMGRALAAAGAAALAARRAALGREAQVLVEERRDGLWRGYSSEYIRYVLRGPARRGELVTAVADELAGDGVAGEIKE